MNKTIALLVFSASVLCAQDGEKATVPLHDPSRPARIHAHMMNGGLIVRGADVKEVLVEAHARAGDSREGRQSRADGMKRLDLPGNSGLDVTEDDNLVTIKTSGMNRRSTDLIITVPRRSSLELKCMNGGDIEVENVDGEIDANNLNGKVTLKNVSGSVLAHSMNGAVTVSMDRIDGSKPMSFSTMNGDIDVTLPASLKANVVMKTDHGEIYSDFDVNVKAGPALMEKDSGKQPDGSFHLRFDSSLHGTIDGGGPEFQFTTFNGQIYIRRKK